MAGDPAPLPLGDRPADPLTYTRVHPDTWSNSSSTATDRPRWRHPARFLRPDLHPSDLHPDHPEPAGPARTRTRRNPTRDTGSARPGRHDRSGYRVIPVWPSEYRPGCGQTHRPWGPLPTPLLRIRCPSAVERT